MNIRDQLLVVMICEKARLIDFYYSEQIGGSKFIDKFLIKIDEKKQMWEFKIRKDSAVGIKSRENIAIYFSARKNECLRKKRVYRWLAPY